MASNTELATGSGGDIIASKEVTLDGDTAKVQVIESGILTGTEGSYTMVVHPGGAGAVDGGTQRITLASNDPAVAALELLDNAVYVDDADWTALTSSHLLTGGIYQSTPGTITDGDTGPIRVDANGAIHINDGGNTITIDGTVTANLSATDNAVLDAIQTAVEIIDNAISGSEMQVDVVAALPAGSNTIGVVDLGATDNAVLDSIVTNTTGLAGTVSGSELQVDVVAALPAGTNAIGKLASNTGVVIGDVNLGAVDNAVLDSIVTNTTGLAGTVSGSELQVDIVAALPAGTNEIGKLAAGTAVIGEVTIGAATGAAGDLAKTQDVAVGANDVGVAMLVKRDDESAAVTPVDGDYVVPTADKFGRLKVTAQPDATSETKRTIIDAASSGDNTLQAAAGAGIKIRVTSMFLVAAGTVNVRVESGAAGTAMSGQMNLVANTGFVLPYNPEGWFETADNTLLNLELSAAISVDGAFTYVEV